MDIRNRLTNRRNQKKGSEGEAIARRAMSNYGYTFIWPIATPYIITRDRNGRVIGAAAKEQVAGDLRALYDGGISVLAEVKDHDGPRLTYSTLERHQHEALTEHDRLGGISLLIWIHQKEAYIMRYPIDGFVPRTSIKIEDADSLRLQQ